MNHLKDRLSGLTYREACKLLGPEGEQLIRAGGKFDIEINDNAVLKEDLFRVPVEEATVTMTLSDDRPKRLKYSCSLCPSLWEHIGAAFSLILEEKLLGTLSAKHELALAALDPDSKVKAVDLVSGIEELKRRLEVLLGSKPDGPQDESQELEVEKEAERLARRERMAQAGGQLIGAAFAFMGEMFSQREGMAYDLQVHERVRQRLSEGLEKDEKGRLKMTIQLPDEAFLDTMAKSLAPILGLSLRP